MLRVEGNRRLDSVEGKISEVEDVGIETIQMETERKKTKINEYSLLQSLQGSQVVYIHIIGIQEERKAVG